MDKFMTTMIPYIPRNGTPIVIVHPNVKIVKKKTMFGQMIICQNVQMLD
jgi:hypothetical protein